MLACIVAISVLVGGGITAITRVEGGAAIPWGGPLHATAGGAKAAVATYLGYVAAGNAAAATRMADPEVEAGCDGFMSADVFSQAKAHIAEIEITDVVQNGDSGGYVVSFEYVLDGVDYAADIDAAFSAADRRWNVEPMTRALALNSVAYEGYHSTLNVSGVDVDRDVSLFCTWEAYPAVYEVGAPSHGFVSADPVSVAVPFFSAEDPAIIVGLDDSYTLSDSVLPVLEEELSALVNKCLTTIDLFYAHSYGDTCSPFQLLGRKAAVSDLTVEVLEYPTITIKNVYSNGAGYSAVGGRIKLSFSAVDDYSKAAGVQRYTDLEVDLMRIPYSYIVNFVDGEIVLGWLT
ncbi:hypothetical protein GCM10022198_14640 [Klugiella xanthotipulae]|uniref:Uncharacterized protein n=1 Tax=Klugiella xanthotipulae TaxID=244735 RepID=A0A543I4P0_9MICO|nr:hypothetical protein [Klugiella xanthotipulae]TQM65555.1 hypothetical protein FB466_0359 [Klugiella xanthotipulae]